MSRSCQRAMSSSAAPAWARSMRARPATCSDCTGFRLWGIADEPFWPSENGSSASRISVRCEAPDLGGDPLEAAARDGAGRRRARRAGRAGRSGWTPARARARARGRPLLDLRAARARRCRPRRRSFPPGSPPGPAPGAPGSDRPPCTSPATLRPNVVGSAWIPCGAADRRACPGAGARGAAGSRGGGPRPRSAGRRPPRAPGASAVSTTSEDVSPTWTKRGVRADRAFQVG